MNQKVEKCHKNIMFLDYDGVINIEPNNFEGYFENPEAIYYISRLCLEYDFQIIVTSSWRRHPEYKNFLYNSGLDSKVKIIGGTDLSFKGRQFEISKYLEDHPEIEKFIIIDDANFTGSLYKHLIQTAFKKGFNKNKYEEAVDKINKLYNKTSN